MTVSRMCGVIPQPVMEHVVSAAPANGTNLREALINWRNAWQDACDGVLSAPAGKGFEDHRACYDLAAALAESLIAEGRGSNDEG